MTTPTDTLYAQQWHLTRMGRLTRIWDDYTGAGVHVGVYDDGIQYAHPDLNDSYDASRHVVVDGVTYDGAATGPHGTSVAGIIAAEANGTGAVGIAYGADVTGVDIFDPASAIDINASDPAKFYAAVRSLNFDVQNHSWGATPSFLRDSNRNIAGSFGQQIAAAWDFVAENGRAGLGTIVVKSAGNDALDANGLGYNSGRTIIDVAAVAISGFIATYSNYGTNILISAPSSDPEAGLAGVVTTDLTGDPGYNGLPDGSYTNKFGGTSAAAPMVSGVVSLMLDANAGLGWRDVQNILANSAMHTGSALSATSHSATEHDLWKFNAAETWNGGGLHFSNDYGFGTVNAYDAVRMAEVWTLFTPAQTSANEMSTAVTGSVDLAVADFTSTTFSFVVTQDVTVENLQLSLRLKHQRIADVRITLTAPDGVTYIVNDTAAETSLSGNASWVWGINALRGQSSVGTWTVAITDTVAGNIGTIYGYTATFYGSAASANDVYHFTDEFQSVAALDASRRIVTDTDGGTDWLNMAAIAGNLNVDLTAGAASTLDGAAFVTIAVGAAIENLVTGDGADVLTGNALANALYGMRGNDQLHGAAGNDVLDGGTGDDLLDGGADFDTASYARATAAVTVMLDDPGAQATGAAGVDTLAGIEALIGSAFDDTLRGDAFDNRIDGGDGKDFLYGVGGTNTVFGGRGNDTIIAGRGIDVIAGGDGTDLASFAVAPVGVTVSLARTGVQDLGGGSSVRLSGFEALYGSFYNDVLTGDAGANSLYGLPGDDVIDGAGGDDTLIGNDGFDTASYASAHSGVTLNFALLGVAQNTIGAGTDTLIEFERIAGSNYADTLIAGTGPSALTVGVGVDRGAYGLALALDGAFTLRADPNIDNATSVAHVTLNAAVRNTTEYYKVYVGQAGTIAFDIDGATADTSLGLYSPNGSFLNFSFGTHADAGNGAFNDPYVARGITDVFGYYTIAVTYNGALTAGSAYTLNVSVPGHAASMAQSNLAGANGNDLLLAGLGDDVLDGGVGIDTVSYAAATAGVTVSLANALAQATGAGSDTLSGFETLTGSAFADALTGSALANTLSGGAGNDRIDGGAGRDRLIGGGGDDTYVVSDVGDRVIELAAGGRDTIEASIGYRLPNETEVLLLTGSAAINATGNTLSNTITGNAAANALSGLAGDDSLIGGDGDDSLNGGLGADRMEGGAGNDSYFVDAAGDAVVEAAGAGVDGVVAYIDYTLGADVENLTLAVAARRGTGNALDNTIRGSAGSDVLAGLDGNDLLIGGDRNDALDGGAGEDSLTGGTGRDVLTGGTGADRFNFFDGDTLANRAQADEIADFSHAEADKIVLRGIDADSGAAGDQNFNFIGTAAFHNVAGEVHVVASGGFTYVEGDVNADGVADFSIRLNASVALVAGDFVV